MMKKLHPLSRQCCNSRTGQIFVANGIKYQLLGKIGDGAAGIVRKAKVTSSGRQVAVKFLAPDPKYIEFSAFDEVAKRFRREGMRGAGLDHENLVKILAYEDNEEGSCFERKAVKNPFIVMEYIRGHTLESLIRNMSLSNQQDLYYDKQTLSIALHISRALEYLHRLQITHRDVKPANIFLSTNSLGRVPSVVRLGDFGVTKWGDFRAAYATGRLTVSHQQGLGTLKYMSPEQSVRPKDVTVRSDMFSFGVTLFELFTGRILPSPHHVFEIMRARDTRGTVSGKLFALGVHCPYGEIERLFELILDMFLSGATGRPSSARTRGIIEAMCDRAFEEYEE
ncbi:MAG: serine/threonine-protein kinase [Planctomycetota bacterium]|jgi:serine/threonine-protein kinase